MSRVGGWGVLGADKAKSRLHTRWPASHPGCMILGKSLTLSVYQFPHLKMGVIVVHAPYRIVERIKELISI